MRTDELLDFSIRGNDAWDKAGARTVALIDSSAQVTPKRIEGLRSSFSGYERNHLFLNDKGEAFKDWSGVSGLDSEKDGRAFVKWDFDRDGWVDIAVVNNNRPLLQVFRNQLGSERGAEEDFAGNYIAIRFVGGNNRSMTSDQFSNRDGYGAKVRVKAGGLDLIREHRCGEGMAAQNSAVMLVGVGSRSVVDQIQVQWPSGRRQSIGGVSVGSQLTFYENPEESKEESGIAIARYAKRSMDVRPQNTSSKRLFVSKDFTELERARFQSWIAPRVNEKDAKLFLVTSMATWCPACRGALSQWAYLKDVYGDQVACFAVPVDSRDSNEKLEAYLNRNQPAYELWMETTPAEREAFLELTTKGLGRNVLPTTWVLDAQGTILGVFESAPTLSQVRKAILQTDRSTTTTRAGTSQGQE